MSLSAGSGNAAYPANLSFNEIREGQKDVQLYWPFANDGKTTVVASMTAIEVTPKGTGVNELLPPIAKVSVILPRADLASVGKQFAIQSTGTLPFTVYPFSSSGRLKEGGDTQEIKPGEVYVFYPINTDSPEGRWSINLLGSGGEASQDRIDELSGESRRKPPISFAKAKNVGLYLSDYTTEIDENPDDLENNYGVGVSGALRVASAIPLPEPLKMTAEDLPLYSFADDPTTGFTMISTEPEDPNDPDEVIINSLAMKIGGDISLLMEKDKTSSEVFQAKKAFTVEGLPTDAFKNPQFRALDDSSNNGSGLYIAGSEENTQVEATGLSLKGQKIIEGTLDNLDQSLQVEIFGLLKAENATINQKVQAKIFTAEKTQDESPSFNFKDAEGYGVSYEQKSINERIFGRIPDGYTSLNAESKSNLRVTNLKLPDSGSIDNVIPAVIAGDTVTFSKPSNGTMPDGFLDGGIFSSRVFSGSHKNKIYPAFSFLDKSFALEEQTSLLQKSGLWFDSTLDLEGEIFPSLGLSLNATPFIWATFDRIIDTTGKVWDTSVSTVDLKAENEIRLEAGVVISTSPIKAESFVSSEPGTAMAPAFAFYTDRTTGLWLEANNTSDSIDGYFLSNSLSFCFGGETALRIGIAGTGSQKLTIRPIVPLVSDSRIEAGTFTCRNLSGNLSPGFSFKDLTNGANYLDIGGLWCDRDETSDPEYSIGLSLIRNVFLKCEDSSDGKKITLSCDVDNKIAKVFISGDITTKSSTVEEIEGKRVNKPAGFTFNSNPVTKKEKDQDPYTAFEGDFVVNAASSRFSGGVFIEGAIESKGQNTNPITWGRFLAKTPGEIGKPAYSFFNQQSTGIWLDLNKELNTLIDNWLPIESLNIVKDGLDLLKISKIQSPDDPRAFFYSIRPRTRIDSLGTIGAAYFVAVASEKNSAGLITNEPRLFPSYRFGSRESKATEAQKTSGLWFDDIKSSEQPSLGLTVNKIAFLWGSYAGRDEELSVTIKATKNFEINSPVTELTGRMLLSNGTNSDLSLSFKNQQGTGIWFNQQDTNDGKKIAGWDTVDSLVFSKDTKPFLKFFKTKDPSSSSAKPIFDYFIQPLQRVKSESSIASPYILSTTRIPASRTSPGFCFTDNTANGAADERNGSGMWLDCVTTDKDGNYVPYTSANLGLSLNKKPFVWATSAKSGSVSLASLAAEEKIELSAPDVNITGNTNIGGKFYTHIDERTNKFFRVFHTGRLDSGIYMPSFVADKKANLPIGSTSFSVNRIYRISRFITCRFENVRLSIVAKPYTTGMPIPLTIQFEIRGFSQSDGHPALEDITYEGYQSSPIIIGAGATFVLVLNTTIKCRQKYAYANNFVMQIISNSPDLKFIESITLLGNTDGTSMCEHTYITDPTSEFPPLPS